MSKVKRPFAFYHLLPLRFFVVYSPEFNCRFPDRESTTDHQFRFGKMIFKRYSAYVEYTLVGINGNNLDGELPTQEFNHKIILANQYLF